MVGNDKMKKVERIRRKYIYSSDSFQKFKRFFVSFQVHEYPCFVKEYFAELRIDGRWERTECEIGFDDSECKTKTTTQISSDGIMKDVKEIIKTSDHLCTTRNL